MKTLVVDDNPNTRQALCLLLAMGPGMEDVREASSGEEAVRLARLIRPALILLDLEMPEMDGVQTARELRALGHPMRIVGMSVDPHLRSRAVEAGLDAFVDKIELGYRLVSMANESKEGGDGAWSFPEWAGPR